MAASGWKIVKSFHGPQPDQSPPWTDPNPQGRLGLNGKQIKKNKLLTDIVLLLTFALDPLTMNVRIKMRKKCRTYKQLKQPFTIVLDH